MTEDVAKFWLGWCQQYGASSQALIPPETRGFFGMLM